FIDRLDFSAFDESAVIHDNYNFGVDVSDDGKSLTYAFSGVANEDNDSGINGYGFVKFPIEKLLVKGDAFAFDLSYTGSINDATVLIRLIEEDGDRWVFRQKISKLTEKRLVVPYMAFTLSEYKGDGSRQFYYVKQFQFGIEGVYQSGSVTVSDFTVTALEEEIEDLYMTKVADNGVIDDFNSYSTDVELYYKWRLSSSNKDEALATEKSLAFGTDNVCARMGYKADMGQAQYATMIEDSPEGYSALSLWAMDKSVKHDDSAYNYLEEVNAEMVVSLYLAGGEEYRAEKTDVSKYWTEYTFAFDDFTLAEGFFGQVQPLVSENVVAVKICFQYYYYAMISGVKTPKPTYVSGNYVYIDNLKFTTATESGVKELTHKLMPSAENAEICVIDDFDSATEETVGIKGERGYSYEKVELSSETAAGAGKSVRLFYQGNKESVSYAVNTVIDKSVSANSVRLLLKGDGKATVYVNIYMNYAGTTYKYRATLTAVAAEWTVYTIGFDKFEKIEGTGSIALTKSRVQYITKITFGIVNFVDNEVSSIFVDKMTFDGTVPDRQGGTTAFTREEYEGQI
ncbi:MAG: hypothetical protein ILP02_03105, partial [Clostridia bacterium]|nr:hypothetical protein [Clostridia bacterium]